MNIKKKSIVAVGLTAISALALGIGVSVSGAKKEGGTGFMGSYDLTAYAEEAAKAGVNQITIAGKPVDITSTAAFVSTDEANAYTLCLTVIDLGDFGKEFTTPLQIGYEIAEGTYYNGKTEGLSELVYSSITFADGKTTLSVKDLSLSDTFANPYFIVAEVATTSVNSTVLNCIVAQKHNLEYVESTPSTCAVAGNLAYYHCTDEGCDKYFTDSLGLKEIADLAAWKAGDGALALEEHTEVTDEAVAPTCTVDGLTQGSHCSVCDTVIVAQQVDPATGHTEVIDAAVDATCTESGLTEGSHCSVCNTVLKAQTTVPANGHTEVIDEAVAATCTETGLTQGSHCSTCGDTIVAQTEIPALGHTYLDNYEDEYCTVCKSHNVVVKTVDGVNYKLAYNTTNGISRYFVATGKASDFNTAYYANEANTLVLENEFSIKHKENENITLKVPVTEIAKEALSNKGGSVNTSIKNIVVPENITFVGEHAFLDNYNIKSAVFLAQVVTFDGMAGKTHTMPFYGCSTDDTDNSSSTRITVYHHTITTVNSDQNWDQFRWNGSRGYIIKDAGGSLVTSGWDYTRANAVVDLNGVKDSTLTQEAANKILAKYYPVLTDTAFAIDETIEANLAVDFAKYDINASGISYKCVFTPKLTYDANGYTHVTYSVSYSAAKIINVYSDIDFNYYGKEVKANTKTQIVVPVSGEEFVLDTPTEPTHKLIRWESVEENGEQIYYAEWEAKAVYTLTIKLKRPAYKTDIVHVITNNNEKTYNQKGHANPFSKQTVSIETISIYEGQAIFTLENKKLTIVTGNITYVIFVNDSESNFTDKLTQRDVQCTVGTQAISGTITQTINSNLDLTFEY